MNREVKQKWVAALRSGKYQQCKGKLFDGVGYCCLGVLEKECGDFSIVDDTGCYNEKWRGFSAYEKAGVSGLESRTLANKNDRGDSFLKIADYIEENL